MITDIILTVTKRLPAVVPHLRGRAGLVYCEHKSMARDKREPLLDKKEADENKLRLAIMRRFRRQLAGVESDIRRNKSVIANGVFVPDNGDEVTEMVRLMYNAILAGVAYNETEIGFALGDGSINQPALEYAKTYVTKWLSELDEVSSKAVRDALGLFISQPGANLGDVMSVLQAGGFSEQRAQRIAVTEITRVYAEANQIYANALAAQYPEFKIKKRYFTNVDDRVCPVCAPLDGKVADYDDEFAIPNPPLHVNCRCWTAVTVTSESSEANPSFSMSSFEEKINLQNYETAGVFSPDGSLVFMKDGKSNYVSFSPSEVAKMAGNVVTHNHPNKSSFSPDDISLLLFSRAKEIRAVAGDTVYIMENLNEKVVKMTARKIKNEVFGEWGALADIIRDIRFGVLPSNINPFDKSWELFAQKNKLVYKKEKRK